MTKTNIKNRTLQLSSAWQIIKRRERRAANLSMRRPGKAICNLRLRKEKEENESPATDEEVSGEDDVRARAITPRTELHVDSYCYYIIIIIIVKVQYT